MSDVVKWGIIIALCLATIATLVVFLNSSGYLSGITSALSDADEWLGNYSSYLVQGRQLLNNFINPTVLTVLLWFSLFKPVAVWTIKLARMAIDAIYKN